MMPIHQQRNVTGDGRKVLKLNCLRDNQYLDHKTVNMETTKVQVQKEVVGAVNIPFVVEEIVVKGIVAAMNVAVVVGEIVMKAKLTRIRMGENYI